MKNGTFMIITISPRGQWVTHIHDSRAVWHRMPYICFSFNTQSLLREHRPKVRCISINIHQEHQIRGNACPLTTQAKTRWECRHATMSLLHTCVCLVSNYETYTVYHVIKAFLKRKLHFNCNNVYDQHVPLSYTPACSDKYFNVNQRTILLNLHPHALCICIRLIKPHGLGWRRTFPYSVHVILLLWYKYIAV